jgi:hypothetical protein
MSNLIRYNEVIRYSRINENIPSCDIANICIWEENEFRRCLGISFYKILKNDVISYSGVDKWVNEPYSQGAIVDYEGVIYQAMVNTSLSPESNVDWKLAPKFNDADYEAFWCKYLAPYLANVIIKASLPRMHSYLTAIGIQKRNSRDSEPVNDKEYAIIQRSYENEIDVIYGLMLDFVANDDTGKFGEFGIKKEVCGKCKKDNSNCSCNKKRSRYFFGITDDDYYGSSKYN